MSFSSRLRTQGDTKVNGTASHASSCIEDIPPPGFCSPSTGGTTLSGKTTGTTILTSTLGVREVDLGRRSRDPGRGSVADARDAREGGGGGGAS